MTMNLLKNNLANIKLDVLYFFIINKYLGI